jgi:hypothetical protein
MKVCLHDISTTPEKEHQAFGRFACIARYLVHYMSVVRIVLTLAGQVFTQDASVVDYPLARFSV